MRLDAYGHLSNPHSIPLRANAFETNFNFTLRRNDVRLDAYGHPLNPHSIPLRANVKIYCVYLLSLNIC